MIYTLNISQKEKDGYYMQFHAPINSHYLDLLTLALDQDRTMKSREFIYSDKRNSNFCVLTNSPDSNLTKLSLEKIVLCAKEALIKDDGSAPPTKIADKLFSRVEHHYYSGITGFFRKLFCFNFANSNFGKQILELKELEKKIDIFNRFVEKAKEINFPADQVDTLESLFHKLLEKSEEEHDGYKEVCKLFCELYRLASDKSNLDIIFSNLMSAYQDDPDACYPGVSRVVLNIIRVIKEPATRDFRTAIPYYFSEFKVHAVESLIHDQENLSIIFRNGCEEQLGDSNVRMRILQKIYKEKAKFEKAEKLEDILSPEQIEHLHIIFERKPGEKESDYLQRCRKLFRVPFEVLNWPMHDSNKTALALELVHEYMNIPKEKVGASDIKTMRMELEFLIKPAIVSEMLSIINKHYFTGEAFIQYLQHRISYAPEATELKQAILNFIYEQRGDKWISEGFVAIAADHTTQLTDKGLIFVAQSLQDLDPKIKEWFGERMAAN